jgi:glutamate synthase domain-containing protein 3
MSGGIAYVFDDDGLFNSRCNLAMVDAEKMLSAAEQEAKIDRDLWHRGQTDEALLKSLIEKHFRYTGSERARFVLDHWAVARGKFVKVFPHEYRRALKELAAKKVKQKLAA